MAGLESTEVKPMMKAKEYRESIANGMRRVRRLYDLDHVSNFLRAIQQASEKKVAG